MVSYGVRVTQVILRQGAGAMQKRYRVTLTEAERQDLQTLVSTGKAASKAKRSWPGKSRPGSAAATPTSRRSTGSSPRPTPASSWSDCIRQSTT